MVDTRDYRARKAIAPDEPAQDWVLSHAKDGTLVATAEGEYTWRDDEHYMTLFVLVTPRGRGTKLDMLNKGGLVQVDIKSYLIRITISDVFTKTTFRYDFTNLYAEVVPEKSSYKISQDNKRVVLTLAKKDYSGHIGVGKGPLPWGALLDVRHGKYHKGEWPWPKVLEQIQGTWKSEEEEPIEIIGHQVVWPEGSRDFLIIQEEDETIILTQVGDGDKVPIETFQGAFQRHALRIEWDDGDFWTRVPNVALVRQEQQRDALEYDQALQRWIPWVPQEEGRRRMAHWIPPHDSEIDLVLSLAEDGKSDLLNAKRELLESVAEEDDKGNPVPIRLSAFEQLPIPLITQLRVCALTESEIEPSKAMSTMLALRDGRRVSLENEGAALAGLERWLQWLLPWLAPGKRAVVNGTLSRVKERLFEVAKDGYQAAASSNPQGPLSSPLDAAATQPERWPPGWTLTLAKSNDVLREATQELIKEITVQKKELLDPKKAFGVARRRVAENLFEKLELQAVSRKCDPIERRFARHYVEDGSRAMLGKEVAGNHFKSVRKQLKEGGLAMVEDVLDWGTLVKIRGEVRRFFSCEDCDTSPQFMSAREGHTRWSAVHERHLESLGMAGLVCATGTVSQIVARLNEWNYDQRVWSAGHPILYADDGCSTNADSLEAIEWDESLEAEYEDDEEFLRPEEQCLTVFLFLNCPAWSPEWGGALRCNMGVVNQDIWGDGGRLVILRGKARYELQASREPHAMMVLQVQGTIVVKEPMKEPGTKPDTVEEEEEQKARMAGAVRHVPEETKPELPEEYYRQPTVAEVEKLAQAVGAEDQMKQASDENDSAGPIIEEVKEKGSTQKSAEHSAPDGLIIEEVNSDDETKDEDEKPKIKIPEKWGWDAQPEPPKLELTSHQVIQLFEVTLPSVFELD